MQLTNMLSFKALASKIHPPLPLNLRESKQLLSLLTASFRQQLDQEHPRFPIERVQHNGNPYSASRNSAEGDHSTHLSSQASASSHLESILTSPLFAERPFRRSVSPMRTGSLITEAQRMMSAPMEWFEEHIKRGTATFERARLCLTTCQRNILASPALSVEQAVKDSNAGLKIYNWLRSSGTEYSSDFMTDRPFLKVLTYFLVTERRQGEIIFWIRRQLPCLIDGTRLDAKELHRWKSYLLFRLLSEQNSRDGGFDVALGSFLKVIGHLDSATNPMPKELAQSFFPGCYAGGMYLTRQLTQEASHPRNPVLFDQFVASVPAWTTSKADLTKARLLCYHPTNPTAGPALTYLKSPKVSPEATRALSIKDRRQLAQLCLGTASLLVAQEKYEDATWALEFARD
ncbi:hypothetical protein LTR60_005671, partial [Cryomyces antarcticus]